MAGLAAYDHTPEANADPFVGRTRLSLERLTLSDFRNYRFLRLETGPRPVVLTGTNGSGKTNLLEALSFLVPGRGLRRVRLGEPARVGGPGTWAVAARLRTPEGSREVGTGIESASAGGDRRLVRIDGQPSRGQTALAEVLSAVWLTPQMDRLFHDGPSARRRFLDRLVFGLDPAHAGRLSAYEHALRERARLLRGQAEGRPADPFWLSGLEETLAARGVAVAAARRDMARRLDDSCALARGPFPRAGLALRGELETWLDTGPALAAEDRMRAALARSRRADAQSGTTAVGPHRADLEVTHLTRMQPAERCSTGEQKALLIAIVLADARLQARERGSTPLLLLDEVVAHLDQAKRAALFDEIVELGAQAWLTGTDAHLFDPLAGQAQFLHVHDAALSAA